VQEPEREGGDVVDAPAIAMETGTVSAQPPASEPKAYAFDGWGMVPLEPGAF